MKKMIILSAVMLISANAWASDIATTDKVTQVQAGSEVSDGSLKQIMQQLGRDYDTLNQAILREDFAGAETAAHAIGFHDKPSVKQRMKLAGELGSEMKNFKKADGVVHGLAIKLEAAAKAKDMPLLIQHQSQMLSACMACHTSYRSRVVNLLK